MVFLEFQDFEVIFEILWELYRILQSLLLSTQISHIQSKSDGHPVAVEWILTMEMSFAFPLACFKNPLGMVVQKSAQATNPRRNVLTVDSIGGGARSSPIICQGSHASCVKMILLQCTFLLIRSFYLVVWG